MSLPRVRLPHRDNKEIKISRSMKARLDADEITIEEIEDAYDQVVVKNRADQLDPDVGGR